MDRVNMPAPPARTTRVPTVTAYVGAAAFVLAAAWYALMLTEVVVDPEPVPQPGQPREEWLRIYFDWFASTLTHEWIAGGAAILGFLCLLATAVFVRQRLEPADASAALGAWAVAAGAIVWVVGNVATLGAYHAIGVMIDRAQDLETVKLFAWVTDDVDDAFELVGLATIGVGFLALSRGLRGAAHRSWSRFTLLVAVLLLVTAAAYAARSFGLVDVLIVVGGALLLPAGLVWTGRRLESAR
jgi:hypothetical protein